MLELSCLYVEPWAQRGSEDAGGSWLRRITDAAGKPLGFVRFEGKTTASWVSWLRSIRLEVYETEDDSHLMTLIRSWGVLRYWDIHDAEDRRVGSIYPPSLVDCEGQRRGLLDMLESEQGRILDPEGALLASFRTNRASQVEVTFTEAAIVNPFLGMLLLGSILSRDPWPNK